MYKRRENDSRRTVQRRFAPGTFIVEPVTHRLAMVVGWSAAASEYNPRAGQLRVAQSWEALILDAGRLRCVKWDKLREEYTLEEWEEG